MKDLNEPGVFTMPDGPSTTAVSRILANLTPTRDWVRVAEYAVDLARGFGARLYVIDVVYDPFGYHGWNLPMPSLHQEYLHTVQEARDCLRTVIENERRKGFVIEPLVREGDPVDQITRVIEEERIDLLLLPAHEENRFEHLFYGKVNDHLIRRMACSILLVRQNN